MANNYLMGESTVTLVYPSNGADSVLPVTLPNWWGMVTDVFNGAGVPVDIWLPILFAESGGNPNAANRNGERSIGLFQLNINGGQGAGYTEGQLFDPLINASVAAPAIAKAYRVYGDDVAAVAAHSGHPGYSDSLVHDPRVQNIVKLHDMVVQYSTPQGKWAALTGQAPDVGSVGPAIPPESIGGVGIPVPSVTTAGAGLNPGEQVVNAVKDAIVKSAAPLVVTLVAVLLIGVGVFKLAGGSSTVREVVRSGEVAA